ncbi:hypothetical protein JCM21738_3513 [Mesobacillus boroniphilus JCM 21738]|uniref:DUF3048 domain-containing protein n=1 Tax=Mesobacillus boroniphilus JCM 21738 TaxID=1294265 RepID=W4RRV7_9BACI|nr:hypothetical protein JCM21738_3513 [Mesobacillus boroniphilus JCM 21738]
MIELGDQGVAKMRKKWIAVLAAAMVLTAGCSSKETEKKEATEHKEKEIEVEEVAAPEEMPYQFPLTGVGTAEESSDRAVAVVVNNHPQARPQSGLHKADIVQEVLAEGDVTRFIAIFQSEQPENIGPVRSAREYFIDLASGYDSFFIAHGYSLKRRICSNADRLITSMECNMTAHCSNGQISGWPLIILISPIRIL